MKIEVTAYPRTLQGTGASRRLRGSGWVPGVIYGANQPAATVELDQNALLRHLKLEAFHASILDMSVEGSRELDLDEFAAQFRKTLAHRGPRLMELVFCDETIEAGWHPAYLR